MDTKTTRTEEARQEWRKAQRAAYLCALDVVTAQSNEAEMEARERYDRALHRMALTKSKFDASRRQDAALGRSLEV